MTSWLYINAPAQRWRRRESAFLHTAPNWKTGTASGTKMDIAESGRLSGKFAGAFVNTVAIHRAEVE